MPTLTPAAIALIVLGGLLPTGAAHAATPAPVPATAQRTATTIDHCLVGTWHDNRGLSSTQWDGQKVVMHMRGGDIDHIASNGHDHDSWMHAKPEYGTYQGYRLKEVVRGHNLLVFRKTGTGRMRATERGWSSGSTNRYVYRGQHSTGYLNQSGHSTVRYRCTAKKLTWLTKKGTVSGTETRISRRA